MFTTDDGASITINWFETVNNFFKQKIKFSYIPRYEVLN